MMMIAFITVKSSLVPLIEGLCARCTQRKNQQASKTNMPQKPTCLKNQHASKTNMPQKPICLKNQYASKTNMPQKPICLKNQHASKTNMPGLHDKQN